MKICDPKISLVVFSQAGDAGAGELAGQALGEDGDEGVGGSGAGEGTRTPDPIITNDVLYQLSYTG